MDLCHNVLKENHPKIKKVKINIIVDILKENEWLYLINLHLKKQDNTNKTHVYIFYITFEHSLHPSQ
jgi:hypothetical protein